MEGTEGWKGRGGEGGERDSVWGGGGLMDGHPDRRTINSGGLNCLYAVKNVCRPTNNS